MFAIYHNMFGLALCLEACSGSHGSHWWRGGIVLVQCYMQLPQTDHSRPIVMTTIPPLTTVPSSGQAVRSDCYTGDTSKWLCLLSACTLTDGCCSPDHGLQVSWSGPGSGEIHINTGGNSVVKKFQKQTCAAGKVLGGGGGGGQAERLPG